MGATNGVSGVATETVVGGGGAVEAEKQQRPAATALAKREPMEFVPRNVDQAWRMAELLAKAQIVPDTLKGKPHDILVVLMTGAELGLSPTASMREIYVVKGKGYISALLKVALVRQSPECVSWQLLESSAERAVFETQRRGDKSPTRMTFTVDEAIRAGLIGREAKNPANTGTDNWSKYTTLMLRRRCSSQLADEVYPDVTRGLGIVDEMAEVHPNDAPFLTRIDHDQVVAPPTPEAQAPAKSAAPADEPKAEAEAKPGEPDAVEVMLAELEAVTNEKDVDAISARLQKLLPKGDPRRDVLGDAVNKARRRVRSP